MLAYMLHTMDGNFSAANNGKYHLHFGLKITSLTPQIAWWNIGESSPFFLLHLREATVRASVPAGGASGLSRLRWPPGHHEVVETVGLLPAGGGVGSSLGPRVSRVRFPASTSRRRRQGITSSRALPRLDGVPLRCRRRARGGGAPGVDPLYRSPRPAACRQVSPLAFCSMDPGHAVGFVEVGWPDRARLHLGGGGRRWRARIREL